jgi:hypothetical protein
LSTNTLIMHRIVRMRAKEFASSASSNASFICDVGLGGRLDMSIGQPWGERGGGWGWGSRAAGVAVGGGGVFLFCCPWTMA